MREYILCVQFQFIISEMPHTAKGKCLCGIRKTISELKFVIKLNKIKIEIGKCFR